MEIILPLPGKLLFISLILHSSTVKPLNVRTQALFPFIVKSFHLTTYSLNICILFNEMEASCGLFTDNVTQASTLYFINIFHISPQENSSVQCI